MIIFTISLLRIIWTMDHYNDGIEFMIYMKRMSRESALDLFNRDFRKIKIISI